MGRSGTRAEAEEQRWKEGASSHDPNIDTVKYLVENGGGAELVKGIGSVLCSNTLVGITRTLYPYLFVVLLVVDLLCILEIVWQQSAGLTDQQG